MKLPDEQKKLREYILGETNDEDCAAVEQRLMTDDDYFQGLSMIEEDLIQAYVDGNLDSAERAKFEKRFLLSEENRQKVKFARALRKYVNETDYSPEPSKKPNFFDSLKVFFSIPVMTTLVVLVGLGSAGFFVWQRSSSNDSEVLVALNKAYRTERPLESRITGLDYAPMKNTRGANDSGTNDKMERDLAGRLALQAVSENPTADNLHTLGRVYLAEKNFAGAIEQFEKAVRLAPDNAKLRNDLGAALMEKAKMQEEGKLETLAKANEEFAKAIESDKNLLDAYFNQALVIQTLNLPNQAREAWQKYLELDATSQWAEEARKNLETIEINKPVSKTKEQVLQEFLEAKQTGDHEKAWQTLSRNREMITGKLIPQQLAFLFVDAKSIGDDSKAKNYLDALVYAGNLEKEKAGDLFWRDLAKFYITVSDDNLTLLKQAQEVYGEALKLEAKGKLAKSLKKFEAASNLFYSINNIWAVKLCVYWIGSLNFRLNQLEKSREIFEALISYSEKNSFKWLATHSFVRLSYLTASQNKHSKSIEYGNLALNIAKQTNDLYNLQRIFYSLAYNYRCLGQYDLSLKFSENSLNLTKETGFNPTQIWDIYETITYTLFEMSSYQSAISFQNEAIRVSEITNDKFTEHLSGLYLGMLYTKLDEYNKAAAFFEESKNIVGKFEDKQASQKGLALIELRQANLERLLGNTSKAIELFRSAGNFYASSEFQLHNYEARKGELLCYFNLKDDSGIQRSIPVVLDIFETYRTEILEEQSRNSFFDNEQNIYDLAIDYEYGKGNEERTFNYSEISRSRSLLDLLNNKASFDKQEIKFSKEIFEPLPLKEIRSQMSEKTQILQYSVLENKVLIWLISKTDFSITPTEISSGDLKKKVNNYLEALSKKDGGEKSLSEELYQLLIKPISKKLDPEKQICIVADKFLFHLPFAALVSAETKHYLVMDYDLLFSPSANVFLASSNRAKEYEQNVSENILVIGNPSFNQYNILNLNLPKLPDAEKEARQIGEIYQVSKILIGNEADKQTLKDYFSKSEIIHFAGHYIVNEASPMQSSFVLKDDEILDNTELFVGKLAETKLIVLSACQTGIERYYQGEGMIGASRTFLAKGIPIVVASQWNVDSEATSELMIRFHNYRKKEQISSVQALRKSQIDLINSENKKHQNPYYWAAFEVFGGDARF